MYYFYIHSVYGILGSNFLQSGSGLEFVQSILSSALKGKEIEDLFVIKSFTSLKSTYSIDSLTSFTKDANEKRSDPVLLEMGDGVESTKNFLKVWSF